jgi:hypothetical protein
LHFTIILISRVSGLMEVYLPPLRTPVMEKVLSLGTELAGTHMMSWARVARMVCHSDFLSWGQNK